MRNCIHTHVLSAYLLQEDADLRSERIRAQSPYGVYGSWALASVIVKVRDDLRQEQLAAQLVRRCADIWRDAGLGLFVHPYVPADALGHRGCRPCLPAFVEAATDEARETGVGGRGRYRTKVLVTSRHGGLIEAVPNAVSLHSLRKRALAAGLNRAGAEYTLADHFAYVRALSLMSPKHRERERQTDRSISSYICIHSIVMAAVDSAC
jgi:phosphatidylinositol 4-kinase B